MNTHLTDEQMYELLDQNPNAPLQLQTKSHLSDCAHCRSEVSSLHASLMNFRVAATNLAAAETPSLAARAIAPRKQSMRPRIWAAALTAATALLAVTIAVVHPIKTAPKPNGTITTAAAQPPTATESDEALLDGIQQDLSTSIPPSLEPLAVPAASSETSTQN
jgi:anti-sigma factor RsiW